MKNLCYLWMMTCACAQDLFLGSTSSAQEYPNSTRRLGGEANKKTIDTCSGWWPEYETCGGYLCRNPPVTARAFGSDLRRAECWADYARRDGHKLFPTCGHPPNEVSFLGKNGNQIDIHFKTLALGEKFLQEQSKQLEQLRKEAKALKDQVDIQEKLLEELKDQQKKEAELEKMALEKQKAKDNKNGGKSSPTEPSPGKAEGTHGGNSNPTESSPSKAEGIHESPGTHGGTPSPAESSPTEAEGIHGGKSSPTKDGQNGGKSSPKDGQNGGKASPKDGQNGGKASPTLDENKKKNKWSFTNHTQLQAALDAKNFQIFLAGLAASVSVKGYEAKLQDEYTKIALALSPALKCEGLLPMKETFAARPVCYVARSIRQKFKEGDWPEKHYKKFFGIGFRDLLEENNFWYILGNGTTLLTGSIVAKITSGTTSEEASDWCKNVIKEDDTAEVQAMSPARCECESGCCKSNCKEDSKTCGKMGPCKIIKENDPIEQCAFQKQPCRPGNFWPSRLECGERVCQTIYPPPTITNYVSIYPKSLEQFDLEEDRPCPPAR